jgi:hypothetical protein
MDSEPGWVARQVGSQVRVGQIGSIEPAGLLRADDEVLAVNGQPIKSASDVTDVFQQIEVDRPYTVVIRRNGIPTEVTLISQAIPLFTWVVNGAARLVIPNIFLLTGLIVFMLKPDDKQALLLGLMFGMFTGALSATDPSYAGESSVVVGIMLSVQLASLFLFPVFFHFFQIFFAAGVSHVFAKHHHLGILLTLVVYCVGETYARESLIRSKDKFL